ncbi:T9SS type B sorting domain-containing protein [Gaetbulibacter sp. M240]|uniref:T9SS type B sorting domain-containing protein n=1 Tax=Gaetbulibacter sp. M240 TaxID=3126511 RepID=UPI00374FCC75
MNKTTYNNSLLVLLFLFLSFEGLAQTYKTFTIREKIDVRGSMLVVGNAILGQDNNDFNLTNRDNQDINMQYIDIDGDPSTFSSSSADIILPNQEDGSATTCYRVAYAGLYWGAILQNGDRTNITNIKFKLPGVSTYNDIAGELIYDAIVDPIVTVSGEPGNTPYACYADVTDIVSGLSDVEGTYTVANVTSSEGFNNSTGFAAGWTLVIIYEDPNLHTKSFNLFDGFSHIFDGHYEEVPVSGFTTPPVGNIDLQFAYAALDGDRTKRATKLEINGKEVTTDERSANKFFGSVIENRGFGQTPNPPSINYPRVPNSQNTLGFDTGFLEVEGAEPEYIKNNVNNASFVLQVAQGQADPIFAYFGAFAVDIIAPDIDLTKTVSDTSGNDIDGEGVNLGQQLFYDITYQSVGNDNVTNFTIKDILPDNIVFDPNTDIDLTNAGGATLQSYDPVTRTIIFSIPDGSVEVNDPSFVIRLAIQVVPDCYSLAQACSNEILNQAFATYQGVINPAVIQEEGSFANTECLSEPGPANFIVDISNCDFQKNEILCGESVVLTAAGGYDSYSWSTDPSGSPVIATTQTYTATQTGTYYVNNTTNSTCISINETFTVSPYGSTTTNPVIPYADLTPVCPNDGKVLPYIFLCGLNDIRQIQTNISDAVSIIWEKLDETSCPEVGIDDCANENDTCTWNQVATGPDYTANDAGQFRLVINYPGGCFSIFYFNVYQNLLNPTISGQDIICTTPGSVTAGNVPSGYEFSLDPNGPFQASNTFNVTTPGYYTIYLRQTEANSFPCIFETPSVYVRDRDFSVTSTVTQPVCYGDTGSIQLAVNNALPQYYYSISTGGTQVDSVGPINASDYTFESLNPGTYTVNVSTDDGCVYTEVIDIIEPPLLTATAALTQPLTCTDGEITVTPNGGTPPYQYYVNGNAISQDSNIVVVPTAGTYEITVLDFNNCSTSVSLTVDAILPPEFTISQTDILCADDPNSGSIIINVTNANGNTLAYSIDNGVTFVSSPNFTGLAVGSYDVVVQYTIDGDLCTTAPQTITITSTDPIIGIATLTTPYTCTTDGIITVSGVSGGTPPYMYSIDGINFQTGTTFGGLTAGTYTVTIQDANNCSTALTPITIDPLDPPIDLSFSSAPLSCTNTTTSVTLSTTGGTSPLEYQIIAPSGAVTPYQSSNTFSGLGSGTYTFEVRDANNCTYSESYTITPLPVIAVTGEVLSNVTCAGGANGGVIFRVSGSTNFTYSVNGGASNAGTTPINLAGLPAGTYTIDVVDSDTGCTDSASVTVTEPVSAISVNATATNINCNNDLSDITINASGGTPNYEHAVVIAGGASPTNSNYTSKNVISVDTNNGADLNWDVYVRDLNGCIEMTTITIAQDDLPTVTAPIVDNQCTANSGFTFTVSATGQAPLSYSINGGASYQTSPTFTVNSPGSYTVTVRDANGCTATSSTTTDVFPPITVSASLTKDISCSLPTNAIIDITASGGEGTYSYEVSSDAGITYMPIGGSTYTTATPGTYQFRVTDGNGCSQETSSVVVDNTTPVAVNASSIDPTCNGGTDGSISLVVTSGEGPYSYSFDGGTTFGNSSVIGGLPAGTYNYVVRDSQGCEALGTVNLTDPAPFNVTIQANPILCGSAPTPGSIDVTINSGGVAPFTYTLFDNSATQVETNTTTSNTYKFNNLWFGDYYVTIVDANGCQFVSVDYRIETPPFLDLDAVTAGGTCPDGATVDVSVNSGGTPNFIYSIYGQPGTETAPTSATTHPFTGLDHGVTYYFKVEDSTGCFSIIEVTTPTLSNIVIDPISTTNVNCFGDTDGTVTFTVSDYEGTVTTLNYEVRDALTNNPVSPAINGTFTGLTGSPASTTITGIPAGTYRLFVEEANGTLCTAASDFRITQPVQSLNLDLVANVNATCNADAQVTVRATGGTGPYLYAAGSPGFTPTGGDFGSNNVLNLDPTIRTNWDILVEDANGCTARINVDIETDPEPTIAPIPQQCFDGTPFMITVVESSGTTITPLAYSIGGAFQSSPDFTITAAGTYSVSIRDGNGCIVSTSYVVEPPILLDSNLTQDLTCAVDATIDLTASGGTGLYSSYEVSSDGGLNFTVLAGPTFTTSTDGTYIFRVTDSQGCQAFSQEVVVTPNTIPTFTTSTTDITCNGASDGTIVITASNGITPYMYSIDGGANFQGSNIFTNLSAGTYDIVVRDDKDCDSATSTVTISEPAVLNGSGSLTQSFSCDASNQAAPAVITITASGGTMPYSYSINGSTYFSSNTFNIYDDGTVQNITVFVRDANGCEVTDTVIVDPLPVFTGTSVAEVTPIDCNSSGSISISVTGGSGNFSYQMLPDGTPQASNIFSITEPGDYYFQVNDLDTGCSIVTDAYTVPPFDTIEVQATPTTTITCFGDTNGELEFTVSGYTGNYTYEVLDNTGATILGPTAGNTSTNPLTVSGLSGGNYSIRVTETDSPFCVATSNVIMIASPSEALVLSANETSNVTCDNNAGTITATATGGWGSYEYELTGSATVAYSSNGTFRNLSAGTYTVNVRDAGGCIASQTLTLVIPPPITAIVTANTTTLTCFGDTDAVITVSGESGGQGSNYSYILHQTAPTVSSSGPQASGVFSGLGAGTYRIEVIDGYNCSYNSPDITITEPTEIQADLVKSSTPTCTTDAQLTLSASGGTGPYQYSDDPNFGTVLGSFTSSTTFSVTPGTYQYYVRDAMGCVANASNAITVDPLPPLVINLDLSNARVNCAGDSTGVIVAEAEGGLGNYVYTLQDGSGNAVSPVTQDSPGVFTNLPAGTYQVVVSSGDCLETSAPITITEPAEPLTVSYSVTNAACFGDSTGILDITASGGTGVIKYAISPRLDQFFDTSSFDNLPAGTYQALVQDELGCYVIFDFEITEPAPVSLSIVPNSIVPEACTGDMNGAFSVEITGGTLPYSVSLDNIDGPYTTGGATQTQFDFTGLAGGNHIVYVMDAQGCFSEWNIDFPASVQIEATVAVEYCRDVNDASTNTVIVTVDDSLVDLNDIDYSLDGGAYQVSNTFTDVVPGNHYITVRHTNTCEKQYDFTVDQYDPLTISIADGELNQVVIATTGGSGDYDYTVTLPNGTTESIGSEASFYIYESGNYTVTVTDSNGCIASASGYFEYIDICITNYFTPNGDGQLDEWGPDCANQFPNLTYNIYDRYGRRVATLRQGQKWDGKYDGKELPTGDYWYVIELNDSRDERSFVGHFTLYR